MGRISASHIAGLDLVDKLFFNQILVHCFFSEELCWLSDLKEDIEHELGQRGLSGLERQLIFHAALCIIEAEMSDSFIQIGEAFPGKIPPLPAEIPFDHYEAVEKYHKRAFQAIVLTVLSEAHKCDIEMVLDIVSTLLPKYAKAPTTFRYRLVDRMFAFEFMAAPFDCFIWLSKMEVLQSDKHAGRTLTAKHSADFLPRLALLCEYDMIRAYFRRIGKRDFFPSADELNKIRKLSTKTERSLALRKAKTVMVNDITQLKESIPFVQLDKLEDPASVEAFFTRLNSYDVRFRVFQGSLASWIGMLCGGLVEILHQLDDKKTAIFVNDFNGETLTERVCNSMSRRGIEITPRAVYDRYRDFKESVLRNVEQYYRRLLGADVAIPPDMNDIIYDGLAPHFELFEPSPRRKAQVA